MNYQSIVQKDNELWINGKKIEQPKSLFLKNCVSQVNGKTYINNTKYFIRPNKSRFSRKGR